MRMLWKGVAFFAAFFMVWGCRNHDTQTAGEITGEDGLINAELYLKEDTAIRFWKIREIPGRGTLTIHEGTVGREGKSHEVFEKTHPLLVDRAIKLTSEIKKMGYRIYGPEEYSHIIIQIDTLNWGATNDPDKLAYMEDIINGALLASGNGKCTGSDIGAKVSLYAIVFDTKASVKTILDELQKQNLEMPVVIAIEKGSDVEVIWPANFQGEFSLI
jgi:hypothetical protein